MQLFIIITDLDQEYYFFFMKFANNIIQAKTNNNPPIGVIKPMALKLKEVNTFVAKP